MERTTFNRAVCAHVHLVRQRVPAQRIPPTEICDVFVVAGAVCVGLAWALEVFRVLSFHCPLPPVCSHFKLAVFELVQTERVRVRSLNLAIPWEDFQEAVLSMHRVAILLVRSALRVHEQYDWLNFANLELDCLVVLDAALVDDGTTACPLAGKRFCKLVPLVLSFDHIHV
jgi:hypothetical protein